MTLSKQDYGAIARVLAGYVALGDSKGEVAEAIAEELADYFAEQNPRFNKDRFLRASGVPQ